MGDRERDEEKRREFLAYLKNKTREDLIYIDETGIDNREDYSYAWSKKGKRFYDLKSGIKLYKNKYYRRII